jgi:hypothetical protein
VYSFFILSTWSESSILQFVWPLSYTITPRGYIQTACIFRISCKRAAAALDPSSRNTASIGGRRCSISTSPNRLGP